MDITASELRELHNGPVDVPTDNVLKTRWNVTGTPDITTDKQNIRLKFGNREAFFITPAVKVLSSTVNTAGTGPPGPPGARHLLKISKTPIPAWKDTDRTSLYYPAPSAFFEELEKIVIQCLRIAFETDDMYEKATENAWEHVNMDREDCVEASFAHFVSGAKLPFDDTSWTIRKNMFKNKSQKIYIPIHDVECVEHTGNFELERGAIVSTSIRLWPYYMNENVYGVSASFGDLGIKVYHKGGLTLPRRIWKPIHYHKIITNNIDLYDIRGGKFRIKTPVVAIQQRDRNTATISVGEKYLEWRDAISNMEKHLGVSNSIIDGDCLKITITAPPGSFLSTERGILILKNEILDHTMVWYLDKHIKVM